LDDILLHISSMLQSHFKLLESYKPSILNSETRNMYVIQLRCQLFLYE